MGGVAEIYASEEAGTGIADRRMPLFKRVPTRFNVLLVDAVSGVYLRGQIKNLSLGGMFVECLDRFSISANCFFSVLLPGPGGQSCEVFGTGRVVHAGVDGFGIQFDSLDGEAFEAIEWVTGGS
ncbi:MAG: PilZ domain-containing protein [Leptospirillia bacterium]